jgi:2-C-methyl-D-erythritol 2,4-cyclodiphosphate synthase
MRVGIGYDSHRFSPDVPLILGGVHIPDHPGLAGHSDGDAVAHAVIDAILGAAAAGNVGSHFPPDEQAWKGADSMELLAGAVHVLEERNYQIVNVDVTVVCETPKIGPWVESMRARLGGALRIGPAGVSVKGKTNEGLGWIGRGEGLAAHAVALIDAMQGLDGWVDGAAQDPA